MELEAKQRETEAVAFRSEEELGREAKQEI